jgi:hypothetical protein
MNNSASTSLCQFVNKYCCCFSKQSSTSPFQDLIANPQSIEAKLDALILQWQTAIVDFENLEASLEDEIKAPNDRARIIIAIKQNPTKFLESSNEAKTSPLICDLALKWTKIQEYQSLLPLKQEEAAPGKDADTAAVPRMNTVIDEDFLKSNDLYGIFSRKLSSTWTARLNAIDLTQGSVNVQTAETIKVRPRWPRYLVDTTFDVIKINKYGHRMRRLLKLTQHHVISIKNGAELTKFYSYREVRRAFITQQTTIKVVLRSGKINTYLTPESLHIFQQIVTRVKVRKALDSTELTTEERDDNNNNNNNNDMSSIDSNNNNNNNNNLPMSSGVGGGGGGEFGFSTHATNEIIKSITEANANAAEEVLVNFALDLKVRTMRSLTIDEQDPNSASSTSSANVVSDSPQRKKKELKLGYETDAPEAIVLQQMRTILFDSTTSEGSTLQHFIKNFKVGGDDEEANSSSMNSNSNSSINSNSINNTNSTNASLLKVRHFIDGLHEYCLDSRGFSLSVLYLQQQQRTIVSSTTNDIATAAVASGATANPLINHSKVALRTSVQNPILAAEVKNNLSSRESLRFLKDNNMNLSLLDDEVLTILSFLIFIAVEEAVFLSVKSVLVKAYERNLDKQVGITLISRYILVCVIDSNSFSFRSH